MLLSDGSLWATGLNSNGQLGDGTTVNKASFVKVYTPTGGITCTQVSCGSSHTQMLLSDGSLWATGLNLNGQLGDGTTTRQTLFVKVYNPLINSNVTCTQVACGSNHTQMLLSDGSLWATGLNSNGQLGDGTTTRQTLFVKVYNPLINSGVQCTQVSCGFSHTQMLLSDGSLWATGLNSSGQLGLSNGINYKLTYLNINVQYISTSSNFIAIIKQDGSLWVKGENSNGQLGDGTIINKSSFVKVYTPTGGITCTQVSCGFAHTQMLLSDGSLWATGFNSNGQLGDGTTAQRTLFVKVYNPLINSGVQCRQVSCGSYHTQMLLSDGSLWATGFNSSCQLGDGTTTQRTLFVKVYNPLINSGVQCTQVSCGSSHTQMLLSDGSLWATGFNSNGQLGDGTTTRRTSFVKVYNPLINSNVTCTQVACGSNHTQMLRSDGSLWATGFNSNGQLGDGTTAQRTLFVKVYTPSTVTCRQVSCGSSHTQMLLSDGSLWATGFNSNGQLGDGTTTRQTLFVSMLDSNGSMSNGLNLPEFTPPVITAPVITAPVITSINSVSPTHNSPTISMVFTQTPADSSITKYAYSTNGSSYTDITNTSDSGYQLSSPLIISASSFTNGTNYSFTLKAYNGVYSDASAVKNSTVYIPALAPVITSVTASSQTATINFTQIPSDSSITKYGYIINGSTTPIYIVQTTSPLTITGLTNGTSYTFTIVANNGTDSQASNSVSVTLNSPPLAPTITSVSCVNSQGITVSFTQPLNTGSGSLPITKYDYSTDNGVTYTSINQILSPLLIPLVSSRNATYLIKIRANNGMYGQESNLFTFRKFTSISKIGF
jgi:alpha-tubulin suppressor-like RCC1 family protein